MKKRIILFISVFLIATVVLVSVLILNEYNLIPKKVYYADDFGIETIKSNIDFNKNGIDDYTDFLLGARKDAENHPKYDGAYQQNGYPPDNIGVCSDVIWRAFKNAGYSLRDMVDADISRNPQNYPLIKKPDSNIDFRRVRNLRIFFDSYAEKLTLDTDKTAEWQAGDIVIFGNDKHIGIVSDKRTKEGVTYIIHNGGQPVREEDYLKRGTVTGHYRFNAENTKEEILKEWK